MGRIKNLLLLITFLIGCQSNTNQENHSSDDLLSLTQTEDDIQLKLDENTGLITQSLQYFENSTNTYLSVLNSNTNTLYLYDLNSGNRKSTTFSKGGPNGVGNLNGFYLHNLDSVFLVSSDSYKLSLAINPFSDDNRFIKVFKTIRKKDGDNSIKPLGFTGNRPYLIHDKLFLLGVPDLDPTTSKFYEKGENLQILNLRDSSVQTKSLFTEEYINVWSPYYFDYYHDFNRSINSFVYSPPASDNIMVMSLDDSEISYYNTRSRYSENIMPMQTKEYNGENRDNHYYENVSYFMILYDKYRDIYYRFVELPNLGALEENLPTKASKIPSIIILNNKFENVGELKLPQMEFFPVMSFVAKDGLYLSQPLLLPDKSGIEENILRFVKFELNEN